jgi:hypothetical protein
MYSPMLVKRFNPSLVIVGNGGLFLKLADKLKIKDQSAKLKEIFKKEKHHITYKHHLKVSLQGYNDQFKDNMGKD